MGRKDNFIRSHIELPSSLPLYTSQKSFIDKKVEEVNSEVKRGKSVREAIDIVNGNNKMMDTKRRSRAKFRKVMVAASAVAVSFAGISYGASLVAPTSIQALSGDEKETVDGTHRDEMILVTGIDERPDIDQGAGTSTDVPGARTDVMAIVSIPEDGSRAIAVSLPRDTNVHRPECELFDIATQQYTGATEPAEDNVKLNGVYQVGGPNCLVSTIEENFGVSINRYASINFDAFANVVNAVGGVRVHNDQPVVDDVLGDVAPAGDVLMDGQQALNYVRARKVEGTGKSDFDRIHRQQQFMSALMSALRSRPDTSDVEFLSSMVGQVMSKMKVDNMSTEDSLKIASTLMKMDDGAIRMTTLPISRDLPNGNLEFDERKSDALFTALENNSPLSGDSPVTLDKKDSIQGVKKRVRGQNYAIMAYSKYDSRALALKKKLEKYGGNAEIIASTSIPAQTTIVPNESNADASATLMGVFPDSAVDAGAVDIDMPPGVGVITVGDDAEKALKMHYSVKPGTKVWVPLKGSFRAGDIVPQGIPDSKFSNEVVTVEQ